MVSHGKVIEHMFELLKKQNYVDDDLPYNWTGMIEL